LKDFDKGFGESVVSNMQVKRKDEFVLFEVIGYTEYNIERYGMCPNGHKVTTIV
jgi:hypothetical protein